MADKKITELPLATDVDETDLFVKVSHMDTTPVTEAITWADLILAIASAPAVVAAFNLIIVEKGSGVLISGINAGLPVPLDDLCAITSYYSNYGGEGSGPDSEGYYMSVYLDGVLMAPGAGNDYRESPDTGTGQTYITFLFNLEAGQRVTVLVRRS